MIKIPLSSESQMPEGERILLSVELMIFNNISGPLRLSIPVDLSQLGAIEDFDARVRVMNTPDIKVWLLGHLAGAPPLSVGIMPNEMKVVKKEFHPPMCHDDYETHIEPKY